MSDDDGLEVCAVCGLPMNDHWLASCPENADPACGPVSWDGEPLYCADTVREGLFDADAFTQMRGQLSMGDRCHCPDDCGCRKPWRTNYCGCRAHDDLSMEAHDGAQED
jgi:hypothetical protein